MNDWHKSAVCPTVKIFSCFKVTLVMFINVKLSCTPQKVCSAYDGLKSSYLYMHCFSVCFASYFKHIFLGNFSEDLVQLRQKKILMFLSSSQALIKCANLLSGLTTGKKLVEIPPCDESSKRWHLNILHFSLICF